MSLLSVMDQVKHAIASPFESKPQAAANTGIKASATSSGTTAAQDPSSGAGITANDFLTLLVTEIQNQDPTTQTDPMQYITQLVGVNSLEQLVQINQTLSGDASSANSPAAQPSSSPVAAVKPAVASSSAATTKNISALSLNTGSAAARLLPPGSNAQIAPAAETAVAHAFTRGAALPAQVPPPTQVPMNPDVMRALEQSIPGATFSGQPSLPSSAAGSLELSR